MTSNGTAVGVFRSADDARRAVRMLREAGVAPDHISVIAAAEEQRSEDGLSSDITADVAADAGIGAALGGIGGLLLGFTVLVIPGLGPVMAAGPLLAALGGAGVGAVAGGLMGALSEAGVPDSDAHDYSEQVRGGKILITVSTGEAQAEHIRTILDTAGAGAVLPAAGARGAVEVEGAGSPSECDLRTDDRLQTNTPGPTTAGVVGLNAGGEVMSADEARRENEHYAPQNAGRGTWPHKEAFDIGDSVVRPEVLEAEQDPTGFAERAGAQGTPRARIYRRR